MYNIYRVKEGGEADMKDKKEELILLTAIINLVTAIVMLIKAINS
nr:MAG TPA: hypothetical protein [Caudoviricetes sp.]